MEYKMEKTKISVIIPAYNTAKYIDKCLESVINQTYENLEIIIVEDCSTDNTKEVLKKYENKDNIKIVYNEVNSGLSYSRNNGLAVATGEYIGYIDSDDFISLNYYESLMNAIIKNHAEMAICDIKTIDDETGISRLSKCYDTEEFNKVNVIGTGLAASACNKLFKRELISKYPFAVGKVNEDIAVVIPAIVNAKKIAYAPHAYYYYIQRNGSIQNSKFSEKRFDIIGGVELTLKRIKGCKDYSKIKDALIFYQIIVILIYVIPKEKDKKYRKHILKEFNELTTKFKIRKNWYFWNFLEACGKKHKIYYKALFKAVCSSHYTNANNLISIYDILSKILKHGPVIPKHININRVIEAAKNQSELPETKMKLSVIVPNYNYAEFMNQRLYSILSQNYKITELIILDDCSKDNSIEVINNIVKKISKYVTIKTIYNEENSGSAFKQWQKGFDIATGDYVWIAEADDYCESNLISNLIKPCLKNSKIIISYADTAFIDVDGNITMNSITPEIDIRKTGHWNHSYVNNGLNEVLNYSYLNCTIANVSSCIIKKDNYNEYFKMSGKFHQAGDWLLYNNIMSKGYIAYNHNVLNYYRIHGDNISSTMNHQKHIDEINKIYEYYTQKFDLEEIQKKNMKSRIKFLKKCWKIK
jgi:glycosyltransferase involved in cell wall biosynthesis